MGVTCACTEHYHPAMAFTRIHVALSAAQIKQLQKLVGKLHLDRTNVIRFAITRLADSEFGEKRGTNPRQ